MVDTYRRYKSLGVTSSDTAPLGTTIASSMLSFPYTYIHADFSGDRGMTTGKLVEAVSSLSRAQGVAHLNLSDNPIVVGRETTDGEYDATDLEFVEDTTGMLALSQSLQASPTISELALSNCGIGPASLALLFPVFAAVALRWLDVSKNKIGVDGATALVSVLSRSNVRTLVFGPKATRLHLQVADVAALAPQPEPEGSATAAPCVNAAFVGQELGPAELIVIAWWLSTEATAGLEVVDMSGNPLTGGTAECFGEGEYAPYTVGEDVAGVTAFATALQTSKISSLVISNCGLGPKHISIVASILATAGVGTVDLSNNHFDPSLLDGIKHKVKLDVTGCRA